MNLYLIRHGESQYNAEGRIQGQINIPLSELGHRQSRAIADAFHSLKIDAVFASPLQRAAQTAQPLAERLGLKAIYDDRLREIHAGIFQSLRWDEIEAQYPQYAMPWKNQEADFIIPGGESRRQLMARGTAVLEWIRTQPFDNVAVVAHGGILAGALKGLLSIPCEKSPFVLFNASISRITWHKYVQLTTLNQIDHLQRADLQSQAGTGNLY
jgi:probable phosphoglycerate mutase